MTSPNAAYHLPDSSSERGLHGVRTAAEVVTVEGTPERLLGLTIVEFIDDEVVGSIESGPWLSWSGLTGAAGSLGVLVDVVLAHAIVRDRPEGMSSVSTEITLDTFSAIPVDGGALVARSRLLHRDHRGGFATGEVRSADGALIAVASQRGRFVPTDSVSASDSVAAPDGVVAALGDRSGYLETLLWPDGDRPVAGADGTLALPAGPRFVNHLGNLHGGMSMLLAEDMAMSAINRDGGNLTTASIRMGYLRPIPAGTTVCLEASVLHQGRASGVVRVLGRTETGKVGTVATVTLH